MLNSFYLIGRVCATPELKTYNNSSGDTFTVTNLRLAVNRPFKNLDGELVPDFFNIVLWELNAKNACDFLSKGDLVAVVGRLQSRTSQLNIEVGGEAVTKKINNIDIIGERVIYLSTKGRKELNDEIDNYNQEVNNDSYSDINEEE